MKEAYIIPNDETEKDFRWVYRLVTVLCMVGVLLLAIATHRRLSPPDVEGAVRAFLPALTYTRPITTDERERAEIYILQADAILKGQTWLDLEPSESLGHLENPYDPAQRAGVHYHWDYAYYQGHYYCYFGVAPVLTLYLPFYWITGLFPSVLTANVIFAEFATLFLAEMLMELRRFLFPRAPRWAVLIALPCLVCTVGITYAAGFADTYYLAVISAMVFCFAFWTFLLRGLERRGFLQCVLFVFAAFSLVFAVLSRPSAALMSFAAIPIGFWFWRRPQRQCERVRGLLAFVLPLVIGAIFVMVWNTMRFGSPFDFGSAYQLTVGDISQNRLHLSYLPDALQCYFGGRVEFFKTNLPAFDGYHSSLSEHGLYYDHCGGALYFPICFGILFVPFLRRSDRRRTVLGWAALTVAIAVFTAWFDYCIGGVNLRYILDILPPLMVCGTTSAFCFAAERKHGCMRTMFAVLTVAILLFCVYVSTGVRVFRAFALTPNGLLLP